MFANINKNEPEMVRFYLAPNAEQPARRRRGFRTVKLDTLIVNNLLEF